MYYLTIYVKKF